MCNVSMIFDTYRPHIPRPIPQPTVWPQPGTKWVPNQQTLPFITPTPAPDQVAEGMTNDVLKRLIDSLHKALEAAKEFDELTGQPDCEDPEKAALMDRVEELERRLEAIEESRDA